MSNNHYNNLIFLFSFYVINVSVNSKGYHPYPEGKFPKFGISQPPGQFFCQMASHRLPWTFCFNKFYTFPRLSRSQSLEYLPIHIEDIYILISIEYRENGKTLNLIHHSQIPLPPPSKNLSNCTEGGGGMVALGLD